MMPWPPFHDNEFARRALSKNAASNNESAGDNDVNHQHFTASNGGDGPMGNDADLSGQMAWASLAAASTPFQQSADMSQMTSLMYQQLVASATGSASAAAPVSASARNAASSGRQPVGFGSSAGADFTAAQVAELEQQEMEDELIRQLLISRRQRQMRSQPQAQDQDVSESASSRAPLPSDVLRMRRGDSNVANQQNFAGMGSMEAINNGNDFSNKLSSASDNHSSLQTVAGRNLPINNVPLPTSLYQQQQNNTRNLTPAGLDVLERIDSMPQCGTDARIQDLRAQMANNYMADKRSFDELKMNAYGLDGSIESQRLMQDEQGNALLGLNRCAIMQEQPQVKRRRVHKKKPANMPRRPLSAYNLFFSEEREVILREIEEGEKGSKESNEELNDGPEEGGEDQKDEEKHTTEQDGEESGDKSVPKALMRPLVPTKKSRRKHRKTHGKISFQQLAQKVGQRWKALPPERRKKYQDLAKEDMARQKKAMEEFYKKQSESTSKDPEGTVKDAESKEEESITESATE